MKHSFAFLLPTLTLSNAAFVPSIPSYPLRTTTTPYPQPLQSSSGYDSDDEYSRCLTPKQERQQLRDEEKFKVYEDSRVRKLLTPLRILRRRILPSKAPTPGALILVKSGECTWRGNYTFTGWADPDLTDQGVRECEHAARLLLEAGYDPDMIYTSRLKRAIHSVWVIAQEINAAYLPVYKSWRLNERMYGSLQGLSKDETAKKLGGSVVQAWRRSLKARPPPVKKNDEYYPGNDRKYADLTEEQIPLSESLIDCMERTRPLWKYRISRELRRGNNVMVVAHSNTLRGLVKIIDDISDVDVPDISFPPGVPFVYKFDQSMKVIPASDDKVRLRHTSGYFLEKPGSLKEALKRQEEWKASVPGADDTIRKTVKRMSSIEESLLTLRQEKEMEKWAEQFVEDPEMNGKIVVNGAPNQEFDEGTFEEDVTQIKKKIGSSADALPTVMPNIAQVNNPNDPVVVFIRHGRTPHNQMALFTGWEDPPLTPEGVEDAKRAGRLLKKHGYEFDVVYSSWLTRAIETAWYALIELDMQWLPIIKSWRLNERHYGALTGKSKKMVGNIYGEDQLKRWRRGYNIPPPKVSSYSFAYPGNDYRRTKYVSDIRISFTETIFRSIEARKFQIHRKFPKSESLKMCMDRTIPFYTEKIVPEAVAKGKRVLITSHENAIRGILMHLCEIPEEHMNELHLPNGLPLIYNVRRRCITLLDEGTGEDPLEKYSFGSAAQYLFRPCEITDEDFDLMMQQGTRQKSSNVTETVTA